MQPGGPVTYPAGYDRPVASVARHLLATIETQFSAAGIELPARRVITVGSVAVDDELLAVMFGGVYTGLPGNEQNTPVSNRGEGFVPRTAVFNIELWRYVPALTGSGQAPSPEIETAAAEKTTDDAWHLLEAAFNSDQMGIGVIARVDVNEPQGEYHGISMVVELVIP
jgi:hypothetical protein